MRASTARFLRPAGLLQVSWTVSESRLNVTWDETEGPVVENIGPAGFGTKLLQSALRAFDGKTDPLPEDRRALHDAMPDSRELECFQRSPDAKSPSRRKARGPTFASHATLCVSVDILLMTIKSTPLEVADFHGCYGFSQFRLTNATRDFASSWHA